MRSLKTQLRKIQFSGFLRAFLSKSFEQLIKAVASLAKNILLSFGLTVPASTVDAVIKMKWIRCTWWNNRICGSATLTISVKEISYIIRILKE